MHPKKVISAKYYLVMYILVQAKYINVPTVQNIIKYSKKLFFQWMSILGNNFSCEIILSYLLVSVSLFHGKSLSPYFIVP